LSIAATVMDCQEAKTGLSPYLDGELPRDDAAGIAAHLTGCAGCCRSFEELRLVSTLIRTQLASWHAPSPDLRAKVMAAIDDAPPTRVRNRAALQTRLIWRRLRRIWLRPGTR
jgi:anti-sigma factor (TIGR02949 family)